AGWPFFVRGAQSVMNRSPNMWTLIALKPGAAATEAELIGFVEQRLARYKRPQRVSFGPAPLERVART
ncbi:MAG: hypothetical protein ACT6UH_26160, partial [Hydrogenophaga sp.]|uniref:hypothetical protein n=1 Tax=Hydrogenophaga sp. TaxID=1904254 RepID=UPI00403514CF